MQKFADAARGVLDTAVGSGDGSLSIESGGSKFPVADTGEFDVGEHEEKDWFKAVLQDENGIEIVYVRTHDAGSNTFSDILRGQEGTVARGFAKGSVFGVRWTAQDAALAMVSGGGGSGLEAIAYDERDSLRDMEPGDGQVCTVESIGYFVFHENSDEPDDDETCFRTVNGAWLLQAVSYDLAQVFKPGLGMYVDRYPVDLSAVAVAANATVQENIDINGIMESDILTTVSDFSLPFPLTSRAQPNGCDSAAVFISNPTGDAVNIPANARIEVLAHRGGFRATPGDYIQGYRLIGSIIEERIDSDDLVALLESPKRRASLSVALDSQELQDKLLASSAEALNILAGAVFSEHYDLFASRIVNGLMGTYISELGGYLGCVREISGDRWLVIQAPREYGEHTGIKWKTASSASEGTSDVNFGLVNADNQNNASHPLFQWARGLEINGFTDWAPPAEATQVALFNKMGLNVTHAPLFKAGGSQAYSAKYYWSATQHPSDTNNAWSVRFSDGYKGTNSRKSNNSWARVVRMIKV